jgi:RHS repeat-associated protein
VISGIKYWPDNTAVAGQQFGYAFDDIGNRTGTSVGGDQWGANLRYASYEADNLNQYTSRSVPGAVDIIGVATNTATVTVNNQPTSRKAAYYRAQLPLNNASSGVYESVTNLAVLNRGGTNQDILTNITGNIFLPQNPENFVYDADGNLTQDGRWTYSWDAENRLVEMTSLSSAPSASKVKLDFLYDWQARRIQKLVSTNNGSGYEASYTDSFAYDAGNVIAELNQANGATIRTYIWGGDLSGAKQAAGGIGGLLANCDSQSAKFVCFDGNGNVSALLDAITGTVTAQYDYTPFGEVIRSSGGMASSNPFRFSTKYQDAETGFAYYGYRYYNSGQGRWLARDPIGETQLNNLYAFVANDPISKCDLAGLGVSIDATQEGWLVDFGDYSTTIKPDGGSVEHDIASVDKDIFGGFVGNYQFSGRRTATVTRLFLPRAECTPYLYTPYTSSFDWSAHFIPLPPTIRGTTHVTAGEALDYTISEMGEEYLLYTVITVQSKMTAKVRAWAPWCGCYEAKVDTSLNIKFTGNNAGIAFLSIPAFFGAAEAEAVSEGALLYSQ